MKFSLAFFLLTVLLLCGVLLHAANNSRKSMRIKTVKKEVTRLEVPRDMELVPNVILL